MRIPISWLKDYVDIPLSIPELAEKLTLAGLEVEHIEYVGLPGGELVWDRDKIFVAQVLNIERHPNADKLLLVDLDYGEGRTIRVVTGAPNLSVGDKGQKVILALKGSRLYDGHKEGRVLMTLKEATLRGIKNDAMVCSEKELGISDEHEGIMILPDDAPVGIPLQDYLGDAVLEIAILPNTIRCASILGVAREVAALTGQKARLPKIDFFADGKPIENEIVLEIREPKFNPRFTAGLVKGIMLKPSPFWMQHRLKLMGQRPINNIVDISNYVMFEIGQPTHTFDFDAIRSLDEGRTTMDDHGTSSKRSEEDSSVVNRPPTKKKIITRLAQTGEKLTTLDGKPRELQPIDELVCDEVGPLALAGVMGGATSEVSEATKNVLLEAAAWNPIGIRKTARQHNLNSEASYRFARGIHPELSMLGQRRGLYLIQQLAGGTISAGILDAYPLPAKVVTIELHPQRVNKLVGMEIPVEEMVRILEALEFKVESDDDGRRTNDERRWVVTAPPHRLDIEGEHDLVEEIARIYGLDKLPSTLFNDEMAAARGNPKLAFEEQARDLLVDAGLQEIVSYRMTTPETESKILSPGTPADDRPYFTLVNPINPERNAMRHTLLAGMLENITANARHHNRIALFEIGSVYLRGEGEDEVNKVAGIDELPRLAFAMTGVREVSSWRRPSHNNNETMDFFDLKGVVETLLVGLRVKDVTFESTTHPSFYPGRTARVNANGKPLGVIGELHPRVREQWALDLPKNQPVLIADFDFAALREAAGRQEMIARDVPRFPDVIEDLAIVVGDDVKAADVEQTIRRAGGDLLGGLTLFDVYRGEQIGAGKKSLAYSLTYQAEDRTMSEKDVEKLRNKIIRAVEGQLGATVRK
jgi:phenylalanyl-tRNA synthetase beta chain